MYHNFRTDKKIKKITFRGLDALAMATQSYSFYIGLFQPRGDIKDFNMWDRQGNPKLPSVKYEDLIIFEKDSKYLTMDKGKIGPVLFEKFSWMMKNGGFERFRTFTPGVHDYEVKGIENEVKKSGKYATLSISDSNDRLYTPKIEFRTVWTGQKESDGKCIYMYRS